MRIDALKLVQMPDNPRSYVGELSDLELRRAPSTVLLVNCPKEGQHRTLHATEPDFNGEDIAGYKYEEDEGPNKGRCWEQGHPPKSVPPITLLLIND